QRSARGQAHPAPHHHAGALPPRRCRERAGHAPAAPAGRPPDRADPPAGARARRGGVRPRARLELRAGGQVRSGSLSTIRGAGDPSAHRRFRRRSRPVAPSEGASAAPSESSPKEDCGGKAAARTEGDREGRWATAPIITLTTDFGLKDSYVAELKAV